MVAGGRNDGGMGVGIESSLVDVDPRPKVSYFCFGVGCDGKAYSE